MRRIVFFLVFWISTSALMGQTMEERVIDYVESFLEKNKSLISADELMNTKWKTGDAMGNSWLTFSDKRFKIKSNGFQANSDKTNGSWYINNEFVVLKVKKEKSPLYILKNENQAVLVTDDQIDVLKQLLTEASYKDGDLKPYSYSEIFTFLNGFTIQK